MLTHTSPILTCPTTATYHDIAVRIREYHDRQETFIEEGQGDNKAQAIVDSLKAQEEHQDLEVKQLDIQYQHLKDRRELNEKVISILRDNISSIECEIETNIRS